MENSIGISYTCPSCGKERDPGILGQVLHLKECSGPPQKAFPKDFPERDIILSPLCCKFLKEILRK